MNIREDAEKIIREAIHSALPDAAVASALQANGISGNVFVVSVGKAAWQMAKAASDALGEQIADGIVITKYDHSRGDLPRMRIYEAGHPVPDENSFLATQRVIELVSPLTEKDTVLFLLSGGGSALFESPLVAPDSLVDVTRQLLSCGADIVEINTIRKRLSAVKGGRFAQICVPARVYSIVLSDIIGDPLDMIASGPAYPDSSTAWQALEIIRKYGLKVSGDVMELLAKETPKVLDNVETYVTGSVRQLCDSAAKTAFELGYTPVILSASLCCTARDAGSFLASIAQYYSSVERSMAFIAGGETVVRITGTGLGGRNQELALSASIGISGLDNMAVFSVGSDGTDGPTDAAGGYVDQDTCTTLLEKGVLVEEVLKNNDSYHALKESGGLIITGPTGTNVNDIAVLLIKR